MSHKSHKQHRNGCCGKQHHGQPRHGQQSDNCQHHHGRPQHHKDCCHQEHDGCKQGPYAQRHFLTKEEKIARLEVYLKDLQTEAQAVQEHIAALKEA